MPRAALTIPAHGPEPSPLRSAVPAPPTALCDSPEPDLDPDPTGLIQSRNLLDQLLADQRRLQTPVVRFADSHSRGTIPPRTTLYRHLLPLDRPQPGHQYAFQVELDRCTGCKACVAACHSLNGLDPRESWRDIGVLRGGHSAPDWQQTVTTACHHCAEPECLHGCPVGAYHKDPATGIVRHLDDQCIGCQYCIMKCPYEVPKYSPRRGIVRKCDMCHQRLEVGEAPACVQACPTEAIRIVTLDPALATSSDFLPGAPDPSLTRPTTRYVGRPVPPGASDPARDTLRAEPAHAPLVFMLVLSQAGVGLFTSGLLDSSFPLALAGTAAFLLGLLASVLHLGRPLGAWRFFLGLRRSWLSREILAFGITAAAMTAALLAFPALGPAGRTALPAIAWLAIATSMMVYVDTKRPTWSLPRTALRFLGTTFLATLLGLALAGQAPPVLFGLALSLKLAVEATSLLRAYDREWSPHRQSSRLQLRPLRSILQARMVLGAGAALLASLWLPGAALLFLAGELAERFLFFRSAAAVRMPGATQAH